MYVYEKETKMLFFPVSLGFPFFFYPLLEPASSATALSFASTRAFSLSSAPTTASREDVIRNSVASSPVEGWVGGGGGGGGVPKRPRRHCSHHLPLPRRCSEAAVNDDEKGLGQQRAP